MKQWLRSWMVLGVLVSACGGRFSEEPGGGGAAGTGGATGTGGAVGTGGASTGGSQGDGGGVGTGGGQSGGSGGGVAGSGGDGGGGDGGSGGGVAGSGGGIAGSGGDGGSGGTAGDWFACNPGECTLVDKGCCGAGCEPVELTAFDGVNQQYAAEYIKQRDARCAVGGAGCPAIACFEPVPGMANRPNFLALCEQARCTPVDLRTSELSACSDDSDCYLRWGTGCCESCNAGDSVALSHHGDFTGAVCGKLLPPCAACDQPYPDTVKARCNPERKHCYVDWGLVMGVP